MEMIDARERTGRTALLVTGLALVIALAGGGFATWKWQQGRALDQARTEALVAATKDAVAISSYDYRELDAYFERVSALATGDFSKQYAKANDDLRSMLVGTKAVVEARVVRAAVETASTDEVVVLLFLDQEVDNSTVREATTDRNRMRMTLRKVDGEWLVSQLELL